MPQAVFLNRFQTMVRVTVNAAMTTGIVNSNIDTLHASTVLPLVFILFTLTWFTTDLFYHFFINAGSRLNSIAG
jgi:hypothetical protein